MEASFNAFTAFCHQLVCDRPIAGTTLQIPVHRERVVISSEACRKQPASTEEKGETGNSQLLVNNSCC